MTDNVTVSLPYGEREIHVELPRKNILCVRGPRDLPGGKDEAETVRAALQNPMASSRLSDSVKPVDRVVIISDDNTRITPTHIIVPILLGELNRVGVEDGNIRVIAALGTHRPMTDKEFMAKLGREVLRRVEVENHECEDGDMLVDLGVTPHGTPVSVNRKVYEADFSIGIGNIVPHHIAGWAGGAKIIQPGVSGEETTAGTHLLSVRQPGTLLGETENVVRAEMEVIARRVGLGMIVNTVLNREGRIVKAIAGDTVKAFRRGAEEAEKIYGVRVPAEADIVLSSSHPCDIEFWQAHKALYPSSLAVKEGGTIILVTPCPEGVSRTHPDVVNFAGLPPEEIDVRVRRREIEDGTAAALAMAWGQVRKRAEVIMVSDGIPRDDAAKLGFIYADDVERALEIAFRRHGSNSKVTVLTHAPDMLPTIV